MFCRTNEERTGTKQNIGERKESGGMNENNLTQDIRFNPYRVRRFGLSSTQEAKALLYLERHGETPRKALSRVFDLRLVERLAALGLVVQRGDTYCLTESGKAVLQGCLGEEHGRGVA